MTRDHLPHSGTLHRGRFSEPGTAYFITKCRWDVGAKHAAMKALERAGDGGDALSVEGSAGQGGPAHVCFTEPSAAEVIVSSIRWHQERRHAHLLGFVVMPDHVHWVFVLGEVRALDAVMRGFGSVTWQGFRRACGAGVGRVWEEDYHDHRLCSEERCWATIEYVHRNPVRKGLCARAEDWPWSTAHPRFRGWVEDSYLR